VDEYSGEVVMVIANLKVSDLGDVRANAGLWIYHESEVLQDDQRLFLGRLPELMGAKIPNYSKVILRIRSPKIPPIEAVGRVRDNTFTGPDELRIE
jgi:hypothetical protein